jgi:transposase, IS6 family
MNLERGVKVDHTSVFRWVQAYSPELDKRIRPHLNSTNDSWKVDETYIKVKKTWKYLYRAIDSQGNTLDFMLSAKRDAPSAQRFFNKALKAKHTQTPRVINVDKNAAYPLAMKGLKKNGILPAQTKLRQVKYLNNLIEQDHRFIKRRTNPGLGFGSFNTARRTIQGYEAMHMTRGSSCNGTENNAKAEILMGHGFQVSVFMFLRGLKGRNPFRLMV